ncbi:MAG: c-type cytochrome [Geminicoccaceae bacterium]
MASSLETNKILAAVLTAGICASGAGVVSRILYHPTVPEEPSYIIQTAVEGEEGSSEGGDEITVAALLAGADVAGGESGAKKCAACHSFDEGGADKIGPNLYGIVGRDIASVSGFAYSDALAGIDGVWDYDALDAFLAKPKDFAPGTKMAYAGMKKAESRADLILYLRSLAADPLPLPEVVETEAAEESEGGESETADASEAEAAEGVGEAAEESAEGVADAAVEAADEVVEEAADAAGEVAEAAGDVVEGAEEAAAETAEAATDAAETATGAAETAVESATEQAADAAAVSGAAGLVAMVAEGDVAKGEKVSKKCKACHVFDEGGKNKLGPALWGIVGRDIGSHEGFNYSGAMSELDGDWTYDSLDQFLAAPKTYMPGTKMVFAGVKKEEDRANLLAYLRTLDAEPAPLE